jgi:hypothetical protein
MEATHERSIEQESQMADFEWDPKKEALNVEKHHFDFTTASQIWSDK